MSIPRYAMDVNGNAMDSHVGSCEWHTMTCHGNDVDLVFNHAGAVVYAVAIAME